MNAMKRSILFLLLGLACAWPAARVHAQSDWLSTPENIEAFRQQVEAMNPAASSIELERIESRSISIDGRDIDIRIYDPGGDTPRPALLYVHGACWVAGSLDSHDEVSRYLARNGNALVIALDYRLAPEHRFPAAHDDVFDTAVWIRDHADDLGVDPERLAIGGESAGAHLAAATALRAMDTDGGPDFAFLLLVYAALDGDGSSWSACKRLYFENAVDARSRYGSPVWVEDLSGMPPTFSIYGEHEPVRAEQELFIRKLREDGVAVGSFMNPGVGHDVGLWLSVSGDLVAHEAAAGYIRSEFFDRP